ncbi:MAG: helix-turn-helix transcriptional regulator [Actinomycetota bacterium]
MTVNDEFLDPQGLADLFGIPVRTVYSWRNRREGPRGYRIGRHVRYKRSDVEEWLERQADEPRQKVG